LRKLPIPTTVSEATTLSVHAIRVETAITLVPPTDCLLGGDEESLVVDHRAGMSPRQHVERKLVSMLKSNPLPVSQLLASARTRPPSA